MQRDEAERELEGVCSNCKQVRRELKIVQTKRKDLADSAKARRQEASSKVKFEFSIRIFEVLKKIPLFYLNYHEIHCSASQASPPK